MNDPKEEQRESIAADAGEVVGEIALEGALEGAFEVAGAVGETVLGAAGELVGGIFDGI